jgi:hypothetical protein
MRLDRRQFIRLGSIAALGGYGCGGSSDSSNPTPGSGPKSLQIDFQGLYVLERKQPGVVVHLLDAMALGLPPHAAELSVLKSYLDEAKTSMPDRKDPAGSDEYWVWLLQGKDVTTPVSPNGTRDLTVDESSSEDNQPIPSSEAGWHSLFRVPDLKSFCGATKITKPADFLSSIALTHGHFTVLKPSNFIGQQEVWIVTDPSGKELARRAFSDRVSYSCPGQGASSLAIQVASQPIVFKPGVDAKVSINHLPSVQVPPCTLPCTPNMYHFSALCKVVDATISPTIVASGPITQMVGNLAGADYCPGGQI